ERRKPGASSEAMLPTPVKGNEKSENNGMQLTEQTAECLLRQKKQFSQKAKIAGEDIGNLSQRN
ncbi:hypothetical protein Tco_0547160, partial [Tanacetum coccineum]